MKLALFLCLGVTLLHSAHGADAAAKSGNFLKGKSTEIVLECTFTGMTEDGEVVWTAKKDDSAVKDVAGYTVDAGTFATDTKTSKLTIAKSVLDTMNGGDTAQYDCTIESDVGTATVTVLEYSATVTPASPEALALKGTTKLTCTVVGVPTEPTIAWKVEGASAVITTAQGGYTISAGSLTGTTMTSELTIAQPATTTDVMLKLQCLVTSTEWEKTADPTTVSVKVGTPKVTCDAPTITKGTITPAKAIDEGASFTVACDSGYKLNKADVNTMKCTYSNAAFVLDPLANTITCVEDKSSAMGLVGATSTLMLLISYLLL